MTPSRHRPAPRRPHSAAVRHAAAVRHVAPEMTIACSRCGAVIGHVPCARRQDGEVTHSYCADCLAEVLDELEAAQSGLR